MFKVLVADDEVNIRNLIKLKLSGEGYDVVCASDGNEALSRLYSKCFDICIVDVMMPVMDGFSLVKQMRSENINTPVIMVTAKGNTEDKIEGFRSGIDDYMVKPFLPKELSLRAGIILRRCYKGENPIVQLSGSQIDFDRAEVIKGEETFPLTAKEHDILSALYRNAGRIVTIDQLCEAAWGDNPYGYENSLMAHIRRIREKIEANPSKPVSLITVKGLGYKLVLAGK